VRCIKHLIVLILGKEKESMKKYLLVGISAVFWAIYSTVYAIDTQVILVDSTGGSGFSVKDASDNTIARFRGDGNVGVGTTTPNTKLEVLGLTQATTFRSTGISLSGASGPAFEAGWDSTNSEAFVQGYNRTTDSRENLNLNGTIIRFLTNNNATERMRIDSSGNVGIGTTSPTEKIYVIGNIYASGSITQGSSRDLKQNIAFISTKEAMEALNGLNPIKFNYKADDSKEEQLGFIAEDVPELVATKDHKRLNPMDLTAVLVKVVQEQQRMLQKQQETIAHIAMEVKMVKSITQ